MTRLARFFKAALCVQTFSRFNAPRERFVIMAIEAFLFGNTGAAGMAFFAIKFLVPFDPLSWLERKKIRICGVADAEQEEQEPWESEEAMHASSIALFRHFFKPLRLENGDYGHV